MRHNSSDIKRIDKRLSDYENDIRLLPGISSPVARDCFIKQIIDSIRRVEYVKTLLNRNISTLSTNPSTKGFNPIKAAIWYIKNGEIEEAFWMVFLLTHFGKNKNKGWRLVNDIYSGLSNQIKWDWTNTKQNIKNFKIWLDQNIAALKNNGGFGNHRKFQSLKAYVKNGTGDTFETYINWINSYGSHQAMINYAINTIGNDPKNLFRFLYKDMKSVIGFGRTGRFDYLTMIGKLGLINIEPDSAYLGSSTGPLSGTRILFGKQNQSSLTLNNLLSELEPYLNLYFGMQVLEDAICNWQKSTKKYIYFGG